MLQKTVALGAHEYSGDSEIGSEPENLHQHGVSGNGAYGTNAYDAARGLQCVVVKAPGLARLKIL